MSATSQEMVDCYNKAFMGRFMAMVEVCPVVGLPSNCGFNQLEAFLLEQDELIFEFTRKGESIACCHWASGWNPETEEWEIGGCILCLLDLEYLKGLVVEALKDDFGVSVPVSMIDSFRVCSDDSISFHCDNGWNFNLGTDNCVYELGTDA